MTLHDLPLLNASLNGLSTIFIVIGFILIKQGRTRAHIIAMCGALLSSTLFLASYLTYHFQKAGGVTKFTEDGWPRIIYFVILGTHVPLAAIVLPLVIVTIIPALQARYDKHR